MVVLEVRCDQCGSTRPAETARSILGLLVEATTAGWRITRGAGPLTKPPRRDRCPDCAARPLEP
jgi:hypothetical protein